jgi:hypothetical protein
MVEVTKEKSDEKSIELRRLGNKRFQNYEFFTALEVYNKVKLKFSKNGHKILILNFLRPCALL